jgi:hypothetical protein
MRHTDLTQELDEYFRIIVTAFAASRDIEWEIISPKDGEIIDGFQFIDTQCTFRDLTHKLADAVHFQGYTGQVSVRHTAKQGGHCWLTRTDAMRNPDYDIESNRIIGKNRGKKKVKEKKD